MATNDLSGLHVFVSGPVTGLDLVKATRAFDDARRLILSRGATACFVPTDDIPNDVSHEHAMLLCLNELTSVVDGRARYDLLVSLPGWQSSPGARFERATARTCGVAVIDLVDL